MHLRTTGRTTLLAATAITAGLALTACNPIASATAGSSPTPASSPSATKGGTSASASASSAASGSTSTGASGSHSDSGNSSSLYCTTAGTPSNAEEDAVRDAFIQQYWRTDPSSLPGIQVDPSTFQAGQCGSTVYVVTSFFATRDATQSEQLKLQDDGGVPKYFSNPAGGSWKYLGDQGFPPKQGCFSAIPAGLAKLWNNCEEN
jgi:hypothetical protein